MGRKTRTEGPLLVKLGSNYRELLNHIIETDALGPQTSTSATSKAIRVYEKLCSDKKSGVLFYGVNSNGETIRYEFL